MDLLSWTYFAFFGLVLGAWWALPGARGRQLLMVAATLVWFGFGVWWHALAAAAMATTSWLTARWIAFRPSEQRGMPTFVGVSLCILWFLFFRYTAKWAGFSPAQYGVLPWWAPNPVLAPLGLSFIMFECIAIQADVYFGKLERPGSWWSHLTFALFFPTRVIGPMRKYQHFTAELAAATPPAADATAAALGRIGLGFLKKIAVANPLGTFALFNLSPQMIDSGSPVPLLLGLYAYWVFLYFDFSGYSDIVIGMSRLLGIRVPENFDRPWRATNISEYWQRWHMSLSFWVREYIYQPAAIAWRRSPWGAPAGAFLSMVVLGLWHGVELRYVAFGVWHGLLLAIYMLYRERGRRVDWLKRASKSRTWAAAGWVVTLNLAIWSHVFYATESFEVAMRWFRAVLRPLLGS